MDLRKIGFKDLDLIIVFSIQLWYLQSHAMLCCQGKVRFCKHVLAVNKVFMGYRPCQVVKITSVLETTSFPIIRDVLNLIGTEMVPKT